MKCAQEPIEEINSLTEKSMKVRDGEQLVTADQNSLTAKTVRTGRELSRVVKSKKGSQLGIAAPNSLNEKTVPTGRELSKRVYTADQNSFTE